MNRERSVIGMRMWSSPRDLLTGGETKATMAAEERIVRFDACDNCTCAY